MANLKRKDIDDSSSFYKVAKVQRTYQEELTSDNAGSNVTITKVNGVTKINATGGQTGEYTAGSGIDITDKVISNTAQPDVTKSYVDAHDADLDGKITDIRTEIGDNSTPDTIQYKIKQNTDAIVTKQNILTAGSNITIVNDVISATGPGGTADFNALSNRPSYNGTTMSSSTAIPEVKTAVWDAKQSALSQTQLNACNSGIDGTKVSTYDGYASQIAGKSAVSVSATGTATDEIRYITIDGTEKKIAGGSSGTPTKVSTTEADATTSLRPIATFGTSSTRSNGLSQVYSAEGGYSALHLGSITNDSSSSASDMLAGVDLVSVDYQGTEAVALTYNGMYFNQSKLSDSGNNIPNAQWVQSVLNDRLPKTATAGQVLTSTSTSGKVQWGSVPAPSNVVTLDTDQTISGKKKFTANCSSSSDAIVEIEASTNGYPLLLKSGKLDNRHLINLNDIGVITIDSTGHLCLYDGTPGLGSLRYIMDRWIGEYTHISDVMSSSYYYNHLMTGWGYIRLHPKRTITGDGSTVSFSVSHDLEAVPGIVQVTKNSDGVVENDVTIAKTSSAVTVTFQTAPASGETYTVALIY